MGGIVIAFPKRGHSAASTADGAGRGMSDGQSALGQWSENHCIVLSSRRTLMSAPPSIAPSFLESPSARQLTADKASRSASAYVRATVSNFSMPVMPETSVKLLRKSTAFLLRDAPFHSGYLTGMELKDILAWIDERLAANKLSDTKAEKRAKTPSLIQNIRKSVKNDYGSLPKGSSLAALAKVLGNPPAGLLEPIKPLGRPSSKSDLSDLEELRAEQAAYREKELEFKKLADAIDVSIAILERKKAG